MALWRVLLIIKLLKLLHGKGINLLRPWYLVFDNLAVNLIRTHLSPLNILTNFIFVSLLLICKHCIHRIWPWQPHISILLFAKICHYFEQSYLFIISISSELNIKPWIPVSNNSESNKWIISPIFYSGDVESLLPVDIIVDSIIFLAINLWTRIACFQNFTFLVDQKDLRSVARGATWFFFVHF